MCHLGPGPSKRLSSARLPTTVTARLGLGIEAFTSGVSHPDICQPKNQRTIILRPTGPRSHLKSGPLYAMAALRGFTGCQVGPAVAPEPRLVAPLDARPLTAAGAGGKQPTTGLRPTIA